MSTTSRRSSFYGFPPDYRIAAEDCYCCLLDAQPDTLIPQRLIETATTRDDLIVNIDLITATQKQGQHSRITLNGRFSNACPVVWVKDPIKGVANPFWVGIELLDIIEHVRQQPERLHEMSPRQLDVLQQAGIVLSPANTCNRSHEWETAVERVTEKFKRDSYAVLRDLIHPYHLAALRRYYRRLSQTGGMFLGDAQSGHRYITHNEQVALFFHRQLTTLTNRICQAAVKPSYVYVSVYQSGAALPRHTDRPQCEYSISVLIDFVPEPNTQSCWPLHLITSDGDQALYQSLGDAIFYRGRRLPHYREQLPDGMSSTSIFFHFVDENFADRLD
jgi:hypothetical protein